MSTRSTTAPDIAGVREFLLGLQADIGAGLEAEDGRPFRRAGRRSAFPTCAAPGLSGAAS